VFVFVSSDKNKHQQERNDMTAEKTDGLHRCLDDSQPALYTVKISRMRSPFCFWVAKRGAKTKATVLSRSYLLINFIQSALGGEAEILSAHAQTPQKTPRVSALSQREEARAGWLFITRRESSMSLSCQKVETVTESNI